jgi:hypothetical protein
MAGQFLLALRAFAFDWKVMLHPVLLASVVMTHVGVAHGHQLTGGLLGLRSRRTRAVDNDLSLFVGDQLLRLVGLPRQLFGLALCSQKRRTQRPFDFFAVFSSIGRPGPRSVCRVLLADSLRPKPRYKGRSVLRRPLCCLCSTD